MCIGTQNSHCNILPLTSSYLFISSGCRSMSYLWDKLAEKTQQKVWDSTEFLSSTMKAQRVYSPAYSSPENSVWYPWSSSWSLNELQAFGSTPSSSKSFTERRMSLAPSITATFAVWKLFKYMCDCGGITVVGSPFFFLLQNFWRTWMMSRYLSCCHWSFSFFSTSGLETDDAVVVPPPSPGVEISCKVLLWWGSAKEKVDRRLLWWWWRRRAAPSFASSILLWLLLPLFKFSSSAKESPS